MCAPVAVGIRIDPIVGVGRAVPFPVQLLAVVVDEDTMARG